MHLKTARIFLVLFLFVPLLSSCGQIFDGQYETTGNSSTGEVTVDKKVEEDAARNTETANKSSFEPASKLPKLRCQVDITEVFPGFPVKIKWVLDNPPDVLPASILPNYRYRIESSIDETESGSISRGGDLEVWYLPPTSYSDTFELNIIAESTYTSPVGLISAACKVRGIGSRVNGGGPCGL